jgi:hypothetical protein
MYDIYYKQTPRERYGDNFDGDAPMNAGVRAVLEQAEIPIVEEYGGSWLSSEMDELGAETGFIVDTDLATLSRVSGRIQEIVGRYVKVTEVQS